MELKDMITAATCLSGIACPKCASTSFTKHGKDRSIQRFRCKDCGKTFKETVNTALHWIHKKDKMDDYIWTMANQYSIRKAAIHIEISVSTSFTWRHKLLSSLQTAGTVSDRAPAGICEIRLPFSANGRPDADSTNKPDTRSVLIADARGIPCLHVLKSKNKVGEVSDLLGCRLHPRTEIAAPKINLQSRARRRSGKPEITHRSINKNIASQAQKTAGQLADWMSRFRGVASKYLQQYWDWFRVEINTAGLEQFGAECFGQRQLLSYRKLRLA